MTEYTVTIQEEGQAAADGKSTADLDEALDWYTNAVEEVMDDESEVIFASIAVDGVTWGQVREGGLDALPPGEGEVIPIGRARRAAGGRS